MDDKLYRQLAMFKRIGVELDNTTLANWMIKCGELVQPLINLLQEKMQQQATLHMDETTVQVLKEPDKPPQSKSYMWVMRSMQAVLFHYEPTRSGAVPKQLLADFNGALMVDGYEGYSDVCAANHLVRLGCWAHARRKFVEAQHVQPKGKTGKADEALALIQKLYRIEKENQHTTAEQRYLIRQQQAKPLLDKLKTWLDKSVPGVLPSSAIGKALLYVHNQWSRLIMYIENGDYPIDNNAAENAIRPFVIGRKNWLFSTSQRGARASANLYSLVESAKMNGLDPWAYLLKVFTELPLAHSLLDIEALLPDSVRL
jgi:transposase